MRPTPILFGRTGAQPCGKMDGCSVRNSRSVVPPPERATDDRLGPLDAVALVVALAVSVGFVVLIGALGAIGGR